MSQPPEDSPPPTQQAFQPSTPQDVRRGLGLSLLLALCAALGLALWADDGMLGTMSLRTENQLVILQFIAPLLIPISLYFFYSTARQAWRTRHFQQHKRILRGSITHLWRQTEGGKPVHYLGYQADEMPQCAAWQHISKAQFSRLTVGQQVEIEALPDDLGVSCLKGLPASPSQRRKKRL